MSTLRGDGRTGVRKLWTMLGVIAVVASSLAASPAVAVEPITFDTLGDIEVAGDGRVFLALDDRLEVRAGDGALITTWSGVDGAGGIVIDGDTLYVVAADADEIVEYDLALDAESARYSLAGATTGPGLALGDGLLYYMNSGEIFSLDPATGVTEGTGATGVSTAAVLRTSPGAPGVVFAGEPGLSPANVEKWDVSGPAVELADSPHTTVGSNLRDIAVDSAASLVYKASGAPYEFQTLDGDTLAPTATTYPGAPYPTAVVLHEPSGRFAAANWYPHQHYDTVWVYAIGDTTPVATYLINNVVPRGLAFSPDGGTLYVVTESGLEVVDLVPEVDEVSPAEIHVDAGPSIIALTGPMLDTITEVRVDGQVAWATYIDGELRVLVADQPAPTTLSLELIHPGGSIALDVPVVAEPGERVPEPPTDVTAVAGDGEAMVAWDPPAPNGGPPVTMYTVIASPGGASCQSIDPMCTVVGLDNGTAYRFRVSATNTAGTGPLSAFSNEVTPQGPPASPDGITFDEGIVGLGAVADDVDELRVEYRMLEVGAGFLEAVDPQAARGPLAPAIINGETVDISHHRYTTKTFGIDNGDVWFECGGVLIDPEWILTAAHCTEYQPTGTYYRDVDYLTVVYGATDWTDVVDNDDYVVFSDAIHRHPDYDRSTFENDIALVKLEEPVNELLADTVPLWDMSGPPHDAPAYVTGWGATRTGGPTVAELRGAQVEIDTECAFWSDFSEWRDDMHVCATAAPDAFCQGDSGGPLVVNYEGAVMLAGLVSFNSTAGCAEGPDISDVYTRVSHYTDWIEGHTGDLWSTITVDAAAAGDPVELTDLRRGATYALRVTAVNAAGESDPAFSTFDVDWALILGPEEIGVDCTEPQTHPMLDVPSDSFAFDSVGCIYQLGVTTGTSPTTYSPYEPVIRGHMALFLRRFYETVTGQPCVGAHPFADVSQTSAVGTAIGCIFSLGVTQGTGPSTFSPDAVVTREQMAAFIARLHRIITGEPCGSSPSFWDVTASSFAYRDIGCLVDLKITTGTSPTTYSPKASVTREQMAAFLERLYLALTT